MSKRNYSTGALVPTRTETAVQTSSGTMSAYALAEQDAFKDRITAAMAKQIMDNTAALSAVESHYLRLAPGGAEEYRSIVQTYTRLALVNLIRGDNND